MNKKVLIPVSVVALLLVIVGVCYWLFFMKSPVSKEPNTTRNQSSQETFQRNIANSVQGKILSLSGNDLIVDGTRGQIAAKVDDKTVITKVIVSNAVEVIKIGNTVSVRYTEDQGTTKVSAVMSINERQLSQQFQARPSGFPTGQDGRQGNFVGSRQGNPSGTPPAVRERAAIGKITTISGQNVTLTVTDSSGKETTQSFDVTGATFSETKTIAVSDLKVGDSVRGFGSKSGDSILLKTVQADTAL